MTPTRERILSYIRSHIEVLGYSPTVREIAHGVGVSSTSTVQAHIETLKKSGRIKVSPTKARSIRIINQGEPK